MDNNKKVTVLTAGGVGSGSNNNSRSNQKKNKAKKQKQQQQQQPSTSKRSPRSVSEKPNDVALSSAAAAAAAATMTTTTTTTTTAPNQEQAQNSSSPPSKLSGVGSLEYHTDEDENILGGGGNDDNGGGGGGINDTAYSDYPTTPAATSAPLPHRSSPLQGSPTAAAETSSTSTSTSQFIWLFICFFGIMASFVAYGLLLEYATSGGRTLHELSFLFVTSGLYTITAAAGRYVRDETPTTIAPSRFAILGLTSMGSTFFSVRSLRYVYMFSTTYSSSSRRSRHLCVGVCWKKLVHHSHSHSVCVCVSLHPLLLLLSCIIDMSYTPFKYWPRVANLYPSCSWEPLWVSPRSIPNRAGSVFVDLVPAYSTLLTRTNFCLHFEWPWKEKSILFASTLTFA
jgi:hypothetical protein